MALRRDEVLRLNMPQWQGGNEPGYRIGGRVLAALLPDPDGPVETVAIPLRSVEARAISQGIVSREALLSILSDARAAIARHDPAGIVTVGGDCLVDLAPIAHLNQRYAGDLAVLWIDAHTDVLTPEVFANANAHVLAMLMGEGDAAFTAAVPRKVFGRDVLYVGLTETHPFEETFLDRHAMARLAPEMLLDTEQPVLDWLRQGGKRHVAVHLDLDVLDPALYDFLLFGNPDLPPGALDLVAKGRMRMDRVQAILAAVATQADVVGLAITEYLPWSMIKLAEQLGTLPLLSNQSREAP